MHNYIIQFKLWSRVQRPAEDSKFYDDCWDWTGPVSNPEKPYGMFQHRRINYMAHRVAWELANGKKVPAGLEILHACDRPRCCNPLHLSAGTHQENMADKVAKKRQARGETHGSRTKPDRVRKGENHGMSKLTPAEVLLIRWAHDQKLEGWSGVIARHLTKVSVGLIFRVANRELWSSVPEDPNYTPTADVISAFTEGVATREIVRGASVSKSKLEAPVTPHVLEYVRTIRWFQERYARNKWVSVLSKHYGVSANLVWRVASGRSRSGVPHDLAFTPNAEVLAAVGCVTDENTGAFEQRVIDASIRRGNTISEAKLASPTTPEVTDYVLTFRWCQANCTRYGWIKTMAEHYDLSTRSVDQISNRLQRAGIPDDPDFIPTSEVVTLLAPFLNNDESPAPDAALPQAITPPDKIQEYIQTIRWAFTNQKRNGWLTSLAGHYGLSVASAWAIAHKRSYADIADVPAFIPNEAVMALLAPYLIPPEPKSESDQRTTLTHDQILYIRWAYDLNLPSGSVILQRQLPFVSKITIQNIGKRKSWSDIPEQPDYQPAQEVADRFRREVAEWKAIRGANVTKAKLALPAPPEVSDYVLTIRWARAHCIKDGWIRILAAHYGIAVNNVWKISMKQMRSGIPDDPSFTPTQNALDILQHLLPAQQPQPA